MGQRIFQIARELRVDSALIVRKLTREQLPPPGGGSGPRDWTARSAVSVGLREMIREWHASGDLKETPEQAAESKRAKQSAKRRAAQADAPSAVPEWARDAGGMADPGVASQALEAVSRIDREARQKKRAHMESLRESRQALVREIKDLNRQVGDIERALQIIAGRPRGVPRAQYTRTRRDLSALRENMGAWLEARRGEKFGAGTLAQEFPEVGDTAVSYVLRPLVEAGRIQADASAGSKRPEYFAPLENSAAG